MNQSTSFDQEHKQRGSELNTLFKLFTDNRRFRTDPIIFTRASGMYYYTDEGKAVLDGSAGLWCCNLGHCHPRIVEAIRQQAGLLDYAPAFQMGNDKEIALSLALGEIMPQSVHQVLFTNSGSESIDTALKLALAYHRARGEGTRTKFIGRQKGYHGAGFGGISVGGMGNNRRFFGSQLAGVDHLRHTLLSENRFSQGLPPHGKELADELLELIELHGAENIAAVIVEPISGSGGVILPPQGYLQALEQHCKTHGILLIFDEVITGFGRTGSPFAATTFHLSPDIIATAKGLTSGTVPMGAVLFSDAIGKTLLENSHTPIELFHGYTYSGHPLAAAAALACQEVYKQEDLFARVANIAEYFSNAVHSLGNKPYVSDIRNFGLIAGIDLDPVQGQPGKRAQQVFRAALDFENNANEGVYVRANGDTLALSPPFIVERKHIDQLIDTLGKVLQKI